VSGHPCYVRALTIRVKRSSVNQQIVIYVFARVMLALAKLSIEPPSATSSTPTPTLFTQRFSPELKAKIEENAWPVFASLSWAFVMYIFRWQPESIQPSLRSSMKYMYVVQRSRISVQDKTNSPPRYVNSDYWDNFRNFLVYNT
jgi:peroxisomal membrane protein 4